MRKWISSAIFALLVAMMPMRLLAAELYTMEETQHRPLFREGHIEMDDAQILTYRLEGNSWEEAFRTRVIQCFDSGQLTVSVYDLQIPYDAYQTVMDYIQEILNENPKYFYFSGWIHVSGRGYSQDAIYVNTVTVDVAERYNPDGTGNVRWDLIEQDRILYNSGMNEILAQIQPGMSDLEKILALHDAMVRECDYDYDNYVLGTIPDESFSALGVFAFNKAVCQGYAEAFVDLCDTINIPCRIVSSESMNHAWNLVYLDGYWYHLDATWDDPIGAVGVGYVGHDYFLYSDAEFQNEKEHYGWGTSIPQATNSGAYAGYAFRERTADMHYSEGLWYYQERFDWYGNVYASKINGDGIVSIHQDSGNVETHGQDGILYVGKYDGIYTMKPSATKQITPYKLVADMGAYADCMLGEFTIRDNQLLVRLWDDTISDYREVWLPLADSANYHVHTGTFVTAKTPTCVEDGNLSHYKCSCGACFSDASCEEPIENPGDVILSQTGHNADTAGLNCTICGADLPWFVDVKLDDWQYPYALYAYRNGIMAGKGKDAFGNIKFYPNANLSRAEFAQVLYNAEGKPEVEYYSVFPDAKDGEWYCDAIFWARENGLVEGYPNGKFGVDDMITREQIAVILCKYAKYKSYDISARADVTVYGDYTKISEWAYESMQWANANSIINGNGAGLNPGEWAARGECAAMIYNFQQKFEQ